MLQSIRDKSHKWSAAVIIGLIIVVFILWSVHGYLELSNQKGDKVIATAVGQKLSQHEFEVMYQRLYQQAKVQSGTEFLNTELIEKLKKQVLTQWTLTQVLAHAAYQDRYRVSPVTVDKILLQIPLFQAEGRFSSSRFYAALHALGYTERGFLSDLKKTLLISQVQRGLVETAFVLPTEVQQATALINQKRDFAYVIIPISQFFSERVFISEAEAFSYYQLNKNQFMQPEQVSVDYIKLSLKTFKDSKGFVETRDKLADLSYMHPASLQQVAKELGLPIQSTSLFDQKGGSDSLTSNPKIIAAAFSQDSLQGNNSPVIDLDANTALVLRVKQHKASGIKPFSEVKAQIVAGLRKQKAIEKIDALGQSLRKELKEKGFLSESSKKKLNLHWKFLYHVDRNTSQPSAAIIKQVFKLPVSQSGKIPASAGFALPNGDWILIKLLAVNEANSKKVPLPDANAFAKKIAYEYGQQDYYLYVQDLLHKANTSI